MSLEAILKIKAEVDQATAQISDLQAQIESLQKVASGGNGFQRMGDAMQQTGFYMRDLGSTLDQHVTQPMIGAVQEAISFETAMAEVGKAANLDAAGMAEMEKTILSLSREIPRSANELAEMAAAGGRLGVATGDLDAFVRLTSNMAVAFDMSAAAAGDSAAEIANNFKMMDQMGNIDFGRLEVFGNVVNNLADNMATTEAAIINFTKRSSGVGQTFGMLENDVAAFAAGFTALGIAPEKASTAFNSVVQNLAMATELPAKASEGFQQLGLDAAAMQEAFASGQGTEAFMQFMNAVADGGPEAGSALAKIVGKGFSDEILQAAAGLEQFEKAFNKSTEATGGGGSTMADSFNIMSQTSGASLELMQNGLSELAIVAGSVLLPAISDLIVSVTPLLHKLAEFAEANPGIVKVAVAFAAVLAAAAPILVVLGSLAGVIGTVLTAWGGLTAAFAAGGALAGVATAIAAIGAGPIIAGIAAVVAAVILIWKNFDRVKEVLAQAMPAVQMVKQAFIDAFASIKPALVNVINSIKNFVMALLPAGMTAQKFGAIASAAFLLIVRVLAMVITAVVRVAAKFISMTVNVIASMTNLAANIVSKMVSAMTDFVSAVVNGGSKAVNAIVSIGSQMISAITNIASQMFEAGANIVGRIADGIMSGIGKVTNAMGSVASAARSMLPMSPVPMGPLRVLNNMRTNPGAKIVDMIASGMRSAVNSGVMSNVMAGALGNTMDGGSTGGGPPLAQGGSAGAINIGGITLNISLSGSGDAVGDIAEALREELPAVLDEIMRDRRRVSYS